jgi:hypothetical protein
LWAVPLLIGAAGAALGALGAWRSGGAASTRAVIGSATAAALLAFIAVVLIFDLSWSQLWPLFVIIPGLIVIGARLTSPR